MQTLKEMGPQIQWLHRYVTEDKVYCIYLAAQFNTMQPACLRSGTVPDATFRMCGLSILADPIRFG